MTEANQPEIFRTEPAFRHSPLEASCIRLLRVRPRLPFDEARYNLTAHSLKSLPPYAALSYCWGTQRDRIPINIDGQNFPLLSNAWHALQQIEFPEYIWIDSICIDQTNVGERNAQVQLMGEIYSGASEVIIWLGLESQSTIDAFEALHNLPHLIVTGAGPERYCRGLCDLFKNDYWSRTWIIQETLLARNLLLACGRHRASWEMLETLLSRIIPKWLEAGSFPDPASTFRVSIDLPAYEAVQTLAESRKEVQRQMENCERWHQLQLAPFLGRHQHSKCADPRDKVYGLLGIFNRITADSILIDYSRTVEDLFMICFAYSMKHRSGSGNGPAAREIAASLRMTLQMDASHVAFCSWLKPRFHLGGGWSKFNCHLGTGEVAEISAVRYALGNIIVVPADDGCLNIGYASPEDIRHWANHPRKPFDYRLNPNERPWRNPRADRVVEYFQKNQRTLAPMVGNAQPNLHFAFMTQAQSMQQLDELSNLYLDSIRNPAESPAEPLRPQHTPGARAMFDKQGTLTVVCSAAIAGDVVACMSYQASNVTTRMMGFVLRATANSYVAVGSAVIIPAEKRISSL